MIGINNENFISDTDRQIIAHRAMYSYPYFYRLQFPLLTGDEPQTFVEQKVGINDDFFLTEIQANYGDTTFTTGSNIFLALYTGWNKSLYRYQYNKTLFDTFIASEGRARGGFARHQGVDRQFEYLPIHIKRNDKIFGQIANDFVIAADKVFNVILKGFQLRDGSQISDTEAAQLERSLALPVDWQIFHVTVTDDAADRGKKIYTFENDRYPRILYGFGATNTRTELTFGSDMEVRVTDISRRLSFTDQAIPLEFLAPRIPYCLDTHRYDLPIEYYLAPYTKIQFEIDNIWADGGHAAGAEIALYTRTV